MKKSIKNQVFLVFLFCALCAGLYAQSAAEEIEILLATDAVSYSRASRFVLEASDKLATQDLQEAFKYAAENKWLPAAATADKNARMDHISLLIMNAFDIKGGIFYSIFKNSHYAYREMGYRGYLRGRVDPAMNVSGELLLYMINRILGERGDIALPQTLTPEIDPGENWRETSTSINVWPDEEEIRRQQEAARLEAELAAMEEAARREAELAAARDAAARQEAARREAELAAMDAAARREAELAAAREAAARQEAARREVELAAMDAAARREAELTAAREVAARQEAARREAELAAMDAAARREAELAAARDAAARQEAARREAELAAAKDAAARREAELAAAREAAARDEAARREAAAKAAVLAAEKEGIFPIIYFEADDPELGDSEKAKLQKIAAILRDTPESNLVVSGHAAMAGTQAGRSALSLARARNVANYLISLGVVRAADITVIGHGGDRPAESNDTAEGMAANRRVVIAILED